MVVRIFGAAAAPLAAGSSKPFGSALAASPIACCSEIVWDCFQSGAGQLSFASVASPWDNCSMNSTGVSAMPESVEIVAEQRFARTNVRREIRSSRRVTPVGRIRADRLPQADRTID